MVAPIVVVTGPSGAGKTTVGRLVATAFDPSVHIQMDDFTPFVVNGWVEPSSPEAAHQNHVLGGAVAVAAMNFAYGGYTVVLDGHVFPEGLDRLAQECSRRGLPLHYAVLRTDLATCVGRVTQRHPGDADPESLARQHSRFFDLGDHEAKVIDASGTPEAVAAALLSALAARRLLAASSGRSPGSADA
jgi:predicted kinase